MNTHTHLDIAGIYHIITSQQFSTLVNTEWMLLDVVLPSIRSRALHWTELSAKSKNWFSMPEWKMSATRTNSRTKKNHTQLCQSKRASSPLALLNSFFDKPEPVSCLLYSYPHSFSIITTYFLMRDMWYFLITPIMFLTLHQCLWVVTPNLALHFIKSL